MLSWCRHQEIFESVRAVHGHRENDISLPSQIIFLIERSGGLI